MWQVLFNGVSAGCSYSLVAAGFGLIYTVGRTFHVANGGVYVVAAYVAYFLSARLGLPAGVSAAVAVAAGAALGALIDVFVCRPLRLRDASTSVQLIASLGVLIVIQNLVAMVFGDTAYSYSAGTDVRVWSFGELRATPVQIAVIATSVLVSVITGCILSYTRWGSLIRAVANDKELALILGVRSEHVILGAMILGSVLTATAAVLLAYDTVLTPLMGFDAVFIGVVAFLIGGPGSFSGAWAGGLLIGIARHLATWWFSGAWQDVIVFGVLIVFLLIRPKGIVSAR